MEIAGSNPAGGTTTVQGARYTDHGIAPPILSHPSQSPSHCQDEVPCYTGRISERINWRIHRAERIVFQPGQQFRDARDSSVAVVGRDREITLLSELLEDALAGFGGVGLIAGEAGIGKSTLATKIAYEAVDRGAQFLKGRCHDLTSTPPYGPWIELLAALPMTDSQSELLTVLQSDDRAHSIDSQGRLYGDICNVLYSAAARQPLAILLDDLHWSDPASLDLLRYFVLKASDLPLMVLGTYRDTELDQHHHFIKILPQIIRESRVVRIDLKPLDDLATEDLVRQRFRLPPASQTRLVRHLVRYGEGNPFFIGEILRTLEQDRILVEEEHGHTISDLHAVRVPPLIQHVIQARLSTLTRNTLRHLQIASVIGQDIPFDTWRTLIEEPEESLTATIDQAIEAHLIEPTSDGEGLRFSHALIREALYQSLILPRRRIWHRRLAESMLLTQRPDPDIVAYHLQQASDSRAVEWLIAAANRAEQSFASSTAVARLIAAADLLRTDDARSSERGWLLLRIGTLFWQMAQTIDEDHLNEALQIARRIEDRALETQIIWSIGSQRGYGGNNGLPEMERAIELSEILSSEERARLPSPLALGATGARGFLAMWYALFGQYDTAQSVAFDYLQSAPADSRFGTVASGCSWAGLAYTYSALGKPRKAREAIGKARQTFGDSVYPWVQGIHAEGELSEIAIPFFWDDPRYRQELTRDVHNLWHDMVAGMTSLPSRFGLLSALLMSGDWSEASELALPFTSTNLVFQHIALETVGVIALHRGDTQIAWRQVHSGLPHGALTAPGETIMTLALRLLRLAAELELNAGELEAAREWINAHDRWLGSEGTLNARVQGRAEGQSLWARYFLASGDHEQAATRAEHCLRHATQPRQPLAMIAAHRLLGDVNTGAGRHDIAESHYHEALALSAACAVPHERALTLTANAALLLAMQKPIEMRANLEEARAICERLEMRPCLDKIARLDAATADHPSYQRNARGLTPREIEVLQRLVRGMTDAEIAGELFISPRTVGRHVGSIYARLGVSSRAAATRIAVEEHLI